MEDMAEDIRRTPPHKRTEVLSPAALAQRRKKHQQQVSFAIVVFRCFRKTQLAQVVFTEHLKHLKTV